MRVAAVTLSDIESDPVAVIVAVREAVPDLNWQGLGEHTFGGAPSFAEDRARMTTPWCVGQFVRAAQWLDQAPRCKRVNTRVSSYGWKHTSERWHRARITDGSDHYVSNGMLIAAAHALGLQVTPLRRGLNAWLNLSVRAGRIGDPPCGTVR